MPQRTEEQQAPVLIQASELVARQLAAQRNSAHARGADGVLNRYFALRGAYDRELWRDVLTELARGR